MTRRRLTVEMRLAPTTPAGEIMDLERLVGSTCCHLFEVTSPISECGRVPRAEQPNHVHWKPPYEWLGLSHCPGCGLKLCPGCLDAISRGLGL